MSPTPSPTPQVPHRARANARRKEPRFPSSLLRVNGNGSSSVRGDGSSSEKGNGSSSLRDNGSSSGIGTCSASARVSDSVSVESTEVPIAAASGSTSVSVAQTESSVELSITATGGSISVSDSESERSLDASITADALALIRIPDTSRWLLSNKIGCLGCWLPSKSLLRHRVILSGSGRPLADRSTANVLPGGAWAALDAHVVCWWCSLEDLTTTMTLLDTNNPVIH